MTLRDAMDRLFDDAFTRPFSPIRNGGTTWASLPVDMYQTDDDVVVQAIGAGAVNQAVKALVLATAYLGNDGIHVSCVPEFADTFGNLQLSESWR